MKVNNDSVLIIGNGFDLEHEIIIKFKDFVENYIKDNNIYYYKTYFNIDKYKEICENTDDWSEFEKFLLLGVKHNNKSLFYKNINMMFFKWITNKLKINYAKIKKSERISSILKKYNIQFIISYNYTTTPEKYGFKKQKINEKSPKSQFSNIIPNSYYPIHECLRKNIPLILGHDLEDKYNKNFLIEKNWSHEQNISNKHQIFNPKKSLFKQMIKSNINIFIFYGFSFGESDFESILWLEHLLKKDKMIIIYYDTKKLEEIKNRLKKIENKVEFIDINKTI